MRVARRGPSMRGWTPPRSRPPQPSPPRILSAEAISASFETTLDGLGLRLNHPMGRNAFIHQPLHGMGQESDGVRRCQHWQRSSRRHHDPSPLNALMRLITETNKKGRAPQRIFSAGALPRRMSHRIQWASAQTRPAEALRRLITSRSKIAKIPSGRVPRLDQRLGGYCRVP